ncbi:MAG TPA: helix-turn-helix domain-containing protein [Gemmatimonadaceae bacterium]|nr:helix-turn-helix domain-containing protein [Gemmatimonadaceae bacterium]
MKTSTLAPKISLPELARRWGWPASRLYRLCAAQRIPHVRIAGRSSSEIFFEEAALETWLAERRRATVTPRVSARGARSRADECALLGIPEAHEFS